MIAASLDQRLHDFPHDFPILSKLLLAVAIVAVARIVVHVVNGVMRHAYERRLARSAPERLAELQRAKRQQTVLTLLESLVRYVVYGASAIFILGIVTNGKAGAVFGASLIVLVGFGMQRLFEDVLAGGLLLFEGQLAVGDVVHIHTLNVAGVVEEFALRTTTLRTLSGDRVVVLNGSINAFTRYPHGYARMRVRCWVDGLEASREAIEAAVARVAAAPDNLFLQGPEVAAVEQVPGGELGRIDVAAIVPPTMERLVTDVLVSQITAELGTRLLGQVEVVDVDAAAFDLYRGAVLVAVESPAHAANEP